jgi:hypothetical protein
VGRTLLSDAFDLDLDFAIPLHQLQNPLMQRRLQLKLKSRLPIQPKFISTLPSTLYSPSTGRLFDTLLFLAFGFKQAHGKPNQRCYYVQNTQ